MEQRLIDKLKCEACEAGDLQNDCEYAGNCEGFLEGVDAGVEEGYEQMQETLFRTGVRVRFQEGV